MSEKPSITPLETQVTPRRRSLGEIHFSENGSSLEAHEWGENMAAQWQGLEAICSEEPDRLDADGFNGVVDGTLAHFRAYTSDPKTDHSETAARPELRDILHVYAAVETSYNGDYDQAAQNLANVQAPAVRSRLESQLATAAQSQNSRAEALSITKEQSAAALVHWKTELLSRAGGVDPTVIEDEAATFDKQKMTVGTNHSLTATKALFDPMKTGRLLNAREVYSSEYKEAGRAPDRIKRETERDLGYDPDNMFVAPLVYGTLSGGGKEAAGELTRPYGDVFIELTPEAQERCTFTAGDSNDEKNAPGGMTPTIDYKRSAKFMQLNREDAESAHAFTRALHDHAAHINKYIEAQISGVHIGDISSVTLPSINEGAAGRSYDSTEVLELADTIMAKGITVKLPYRPPDIRSVSDRAERSAISKKIVGESFRQFTERIQRTHPGLIVEDRRTPEEKHDLTDEKFISSADANEEASEQSRRYAEEAEKRAEREKKDGRMAISAYNVIDVEA